MNTRVSIITRKEGEHHIILRKKAPGVWQIIDNTLAWGYNPIVDSTELGFIEWDREVGDLDHGSSDESQCFGISSHLVWKEVELTPQEIHAPSLREIRKALQHITFCAWCPGDI